MAAPVLEVATRASPVPEANKKTSPVPETNEKADPTPEAGMEGPPVPESTAKANSAPEVLKGSLWPHHSENTQSCLILGAKPRRARRNWIPEPTGLPHDVPVWGSGVRPREGVTVICSWQEFHGLRKPRSRERLLGS